MTNKVIVTKSKLNAIGNQIRAKLGETQQYTLDEMTNKIGAISSNNGFIHIVNPIIEVSSFTTPVQRITVTEVIPYEA